MEVELPPPILPSTAAVAAAIQQASFKAILEVARVASMHLGKREILEETAAVA
jgi:hypothetical protein